MHKKITSFAALLLAGLLLLVSTSPAAAQPAAVQTADTTTTTQQLQAPLTGNIAGGVPALYEGEMDDLGPQYVLQPKPPVKYFQLMGDLQTYRSNNATLSQMNKGTTDITVLTVAALLQSEETQLWEDLKVTGRVGFRYQSFWYGVLTGRDDIITGLKAKFNDFMTYTPYTEASFVKGNWVSTVGLRFSMFKNDSANASGTFYQELVPYWSFGYQYPINPKEIFLVQYDGDYRGTNTPSGGLLPTGWNDRTDHSISFIYSYIINNHWIIQPSYRLSWTNYTNDFRDRNDIYNTLSLVVAYYFTDSLSVRAFTSYEWRDSSELLQNYESWNIGFGGGFTYSF